MDFDQFFWRVGVWLGIEAIRFFWQCSSQSEIREFLKDTYNSCTVSPLYSPGGSAVHVVGLGSLITSGYIYFDNGVIFCTIDNEEHFNVLIHPCIATVFGIGCVPVMWSVFAKLEVAYPGF